MVSQISKLTALDCNRGALSLNPDPATYILPTTGLKGSCQLLMKVSVH